MIITCPQCSFSRDAGDVRIPFHGARAACPNCGARFMLKPEQSAPDVGQLIRTCPSCSYTHRPGDMSGTCPECGLVYEKYLRRRPAVEDEPPATVPDDTPSDGKGTPRGRRRLTRNTTFLVIMALFFVALCLYYGYDWKLDKDYRLVPSAWQGEITFRGKQYPFVLVITSAVSGRMEGYTDWVGLQTPYRLAVRGTYRGNHLEFEDYRFLRGEGMYGLHDKKDVYIAENVMSGSDKNGDAEFHAVRMQSQYVPK